MGSSIERVGWIGVAVGGALGAIAGAAFFLSDSPKAPLVVPLVTVGAGCICGFCASVASVLVACIVQLFRRDKTEPAKTGQPQGSASRNQPAADA